MNEAAIIEKAPRKAESRAVLIARINKGLTAEKSSFPQIGADLKSLEKKAYKKDANDNRTFAEFCKEEWDFERRQAYYYIQASEVFENVTSMSQKTLGFTHAIAMHVLTPEEQNELSGRVNFSTITVKELKEKIAEIRPTVEKPEKELTEDGLYSRLHADVMHLYADVAAARRRTLIHLHVDRLKKEF